MITTFITLLAWAFGLLAIARIVALVCSDHDEPWLRVAEAQGHKPVEVAILKAALVALVCVAWLIAKAQH